MTVVSFSTSSPPGLAAVASVLEELEKLMEQAKSGELRQIAFVCVYPDRSTDADWSTGDYAPELCAGIMDLFWRIGSERFLRAYPNGLLPSSG